MPAHTVIGRFLELAVEEPDAPTVMEKRRGRWGTWSRQALAQRVSDLADALEGLALPAGSLVLIAAEDRVDWIVLDLAAQAVGLRVCAVPDDLGDAALRRAIEVTDPALIAVTGQVAGDQMLEAIDAVGGAHRRLLDIGPPNNQPVHDPRVRKLADLLPDTPGERFGGLSERVAALDAVAVAVVALGTAAEAGGDPVQLDHASLLAGAEAVIGGVGLDASDLALSFRPLADPTDRTTTLYAALLSGSRLALPESRGAAQSAMYEIAPTYVHVTRRWLDQIAFAVWGRLTNSRGVKGLLGRHWTGKLGRGESLHGIVTKYAVRFPVIEKLGLHRAKAIVVSGSSPGHDERGFVASLGLPVRPAYALSEAGGIVTLAESLRGEVGACGPALPGVELHLDDDGQVVVSGALITGSELVTGDHGRVTDEGLVLLGRRGDVLRLSDGVALEGLPVEIALRSSLFIREAVVTPDAASGVLTVTVELIRESVERWALRRDLTFATFRALAAMPEVVEMVRGEVVERLEGLGITAEVDVRVLDLSLEELPGALTASGRVRGHVMEQAGAAKVTVG